MADWLTVQAFALLYWTCIRGVVNADWSAFSSTIDNDAGLIALEAIRIAGA